MISSVIPENVVRACLVVLLTALAPLAVAERGDQKTGNLDLKIASLVEQLGSDRFQERAEAQRELLEMDKEILPILERIDEPEDLEARIRFRKILNWMRTLPLLGTRWKVEHTSDVGVQDMVIEFMEDGMFRTVDKAQPTPENETWDEPLFHPSGDLIRFHFNDKYSTYEGHRVDQKTIVGSSENIKGVTWTWRATLIEETDPQDVEEGEDEE